MRRTIIYVFCAFATMSCGGSQGSEAGSIEEKTDFFVFDFEDNFDSEIKATTLNEFTRSVSYIPLETDKDFLLPELYGFAKDGNHLFIGGGRIPGSAPIYQFDSLGKFVRQVTHNGRGPDEIMLAMEWYANSNLKQINVVSTGGRMVVFSTESEERFTIEYDELQGFYRVPLNDGTFVSSMSVMSAPSTTKQYLYFINREGVVIEAKDRHDVKAEYRVRLMEGAEWGGPWEQYWLSPNYDGDAIFHDIFNDTLYRVKSHKEITPHLVFKRGALSPRPDDTNKPENKKRQVYFSGVMESEDYVFLNYMHDDKVWNDVWSKQNGRRLIHVAKNKPGRISDIVFPFVLPDGSEIELRVVYADRDNVYGIMEALDACKFMPDVREDDNPVIVIARLK